MILLGDHCHALAIGRAHSSADIPSSHFAVGTDGAIPSGFLVVGMVELERRKISWRRGFPVHLCHYVQVALSRHQASLESRRYPALSVRAPGIVCRLRLDI
jgi:hypothetical protein